MMESEPTRQESSAREAAAVQQSPNSAKRSEGVQDLVSSILAFVSVKTEEGEQSKTD